MSKLTPGDLVNQLLTQAEVARVCGVSRVTVWRWCQPRPEGTGGRVPEPYHEAIVKLARAEGIELAAEELHLGRAKKRRAA
jgi:transcriptional regulator with XRE-family HTH domain